MNEDRRDRPFGRIVVAFDASPQGHALLPLLYADLPIAEEVSLGSATVMGLSSERMRSHSRAQARLARRALDAAALQHRLSCSFLTHRGKITTALSAHVEARDLIMVSSRIGGAPAPKRQDTLAELMECTAGGLLTLFDSRSELTAGPVAIVLGSESGAADLAMAAARRIAERRSSDLTVYWMGSGEEEESASSEALAMFRKLPNVRLETVSDSGQLGESLKSGNPSLVVLAEGLDDQARRAAVALGQPILMVRRSEG